MLTVGTLAGALICSASSAASAAEHESFHGVFRETALAAAPPLHYDIHGSAKMTTGAAGTTVKINVSGLDPTKTYGSHLHNGNCASGGGGHYRAGRRSDRLRRSVVTREPRRADTVGRGVLALDPPCTTDV